MSIFPKKKILKILKKNTGNKKGVEFSIYIFKTFIKKSFCFQGDKRKKMLEIRDLKKKKKMYNQQLFTVFAFFTLLI